VTKVFGGGSGGHHSAIGVEAFKKKAEPKKEEHIMFLGQMGFRRLWYRAMCGMCCRDKYWNTYMSTLKKVEDDMK